MSQAVARTAIRGVERADHDQSPGEAGTHRISARWLGALFLAAFGFYGGGSLMVEQVTGAEGLIGEIVASEPQLRIAALLIVANSIVVVTIGALMYRLTATLEPYIRLAYLGARLFEGVILALGAVFVLLLIPAAEEGDSGLARVLIEGNDFAYQAAMIGLCAGSIPLFWTLANAGAIPRWLGLWGVIGYAVFGTGAALEIYDISAGVILSVPGGIFEVTFAVYLLWKGLPAQPGDSEDGLEEHLPATS